MLSKYDRVIETVFSRNYKAGMRRVPFNREELASACEEHGIPRIKNLGDITYSYRFRRNLPTKIRQAVPNECEWMIMGEGIGAYAFRLCKSSKVEPAENRLRFKIPDSTPEIVNMYAPGEDEQALLTKVRYNRLIDLFTGLACYSIQNHLRTTVAGIGQIEVDEIYLGVDKNGAHYVLPCQAKSPGDSFGIAQVLQDMRFCAERYTHLTCRPIAMQFMGRNSLAMFELTVEEEEDIVGLVVVDEKHYQLVKHDRLSVADLKKYKRLSNIVGKTSGVH